MRKNILIIFSIIIISISFGLYFFIEKDFEKVKEITITDNNCYLELEWEIEDIIYSSEDIIIKCWVAQTNDTNQYINRSILLKDEDGNIKSIKSEADIRSDLEGKNTSNTNYNKCGLIGRVKIEKLTKGKKYQVGFKVITQDEKESIIFTDSIIEVS